MRSHNTAHWQNIKDLEGLLFFSQLIDEMLFDYTLDSYKPLALNSRLLCIECFETIHEVEKGFVPKKNLQSVVEELKWSLQKDKAAQKIFGIKFEYYIERLKPNDIKINELRDIVGFFYHSFEDRKYLKKVIGLLAELVVDGKNKEVIKALTGTFITELVNYGYNAQHIYYQNFNFFFNHQKRQSILASSDINNFFEIFDFEEKEFTAVFIGSIIFRNFRNTLNSFDIVVTKTYNCFSNIPEDIKFQKSRSDNSSFIICSKIMALDHHSARERAETLIGQITGIFNFYHHKVKPEIFNKVVVCRTSDNYVVVIDKPTKSILKTKSDEHPVEAAKSVERTLSGLSMNRESTHRFARSIDLHSAALASTSVENQLLDLWAGLETLLPKSSEVGKDRIVQVCEALVPFLQLDYIQKQLYEVYKDLQIWNQQAIEAFLDRIPNGASYSVLEKIGALISLDSTKALRLELYNELATFPLLKNRVYYLHESFSSPERIDKILRTHEIKINWHLRRIYRTRGQVIHSGKYPSYTPILIENLHNYLDLFLNKIIDLSINKKINSIEQGVLETQVAVQFQMELLKKHKGENLTEDNFKEALLGEKQNHS